MNIAINIHIYPSYFTNESRILREAKALVDLNIVSRIILIGIKRKDLPGVENISPQIELLRLPTSTNKFSFFKFLNLYPFLIFYLRTFILCKRIKPQVVNCHSLTVLPLGVLIKWFFKSKLVYDAHELETETNESTGVRKVLAKLIERLFINFSDFNIVVGHQIQQWYISKYRLSNIAVIRNIPVTDEAIRKMAAPRSLKQELGIDANEKIFLYLGALSQGRGISIMLEAFKCVDKRKHLVFVGFGPLSSLIIKESQNNSNIHFLPAVPPNEVIQLTSQADVGISLIENTCLSYFYSLPNKVFEYMKSGIPFIASDFPEIKQEFSESNFAWLIPPKTECLLQLITSIESSDIYTKKGIIEDKSSLWSWDQERRKYEIIYQRIITKND